MAQEQLVKYLLNPNNLNPNVPPAGITLDQVKGQLISQFFSYAGRIVNMRKQYRYDTALWKGATAITPANQVNLFRLGVGQQDAWANDNTDTFKKNYVHTNMFTDGEYQPGEVGIIYQMEVILRNLNAGTPTTSADGMVSVAAVAAFSAVVDIFLLLDTFNRQFYYEFLRGGQRQVMVEGRGYDFPEKNAVSGVGGSSATFVSGTANNAGYGDINLFQKLEVIEGKEDFSVSIQPMAPTLTVARDVYTEVRLATWEWLRVYA